MTSTTPIDELVLTHHFGEDGIIYLSATGKISNDHLLEFSTWTDEVKTLIRERAELGDNPILVMTDITLATHFERKPVAVLKDMLLYNSQFPIRSTIVGGNRFAVLMLDSIVSLLGLSALRHFRDKESAQKWLLTKRQFPHAQDTA